jgi:NADPH:quinone reductase-like Zn-dependent oxidoreductase
MTEAALAHATSPARAVFHTAPLCVDIREVPTPRPAAGEVLVPFSYPFAYGYACVGEVAESGRAVFAFHPHQDVFAARADELIALPAIDPASATLFPLVETALQVTLDAGTGYRDRVIVLGAGVLGLLTGLLLQRSGWRPLLAEPQAWRRALAASLGVAAAAPEELADEKVPLVIDASGNPDAPAMALMHAVLDYDRSAAGGM